MAHYKIVQCHHRNFEYPEGPKCGKKSLLHLEAS